jgi:hypothetical protein
MKKELREEERHNLENKGPGTLSALVKIHDLEVPYSGYPTALSAPALCLYYTSS